MDGAFIALYYSLVWLSKYENFVLLKISVNFCFEEIYLKCIFLEEKFFTNLFRENVYTFKFFFYKDKTFINKIINYEKKIPSSPNPLKTTQKDSECKTKLISLFIYSYTISHTPVRILPLHSTTIVG